MADAIIQHIGLYLRGDCRYDVMYTYSEYGDKTPRNSHRVAIFYDRRIAYLHAIDVMASIYDRIKPEGARLVDGEKIYTFASLMMMGTSHQDIRARILFLENCVDLYYGSNKPLHYVQHIVELRCHTNECELPVRYFEPMVNVLQKKRDQLDKEVSKKRARKAV